MAVVFQIFLVLNSLCLTFAIFLINKHITLINKVHPLLEHTPAFISYILYFLCALLIARISIFLARYLGTDTISEGSLSEIEPANDAYLPVYLGYFFVALSVESYEIFLFVFGMLCIFILASRMAYFNPLYSLWGYQFYYAKSSTNLKTLIITRKHFKDANLIEFNKIKRINDYTFIDLGEK